MKFKGPIRAVLTPAVFLIFSTAAQAQTATGTSSAGSSGRMWGSSTVAGGTTDSSTIHNQDGNSAGQVNAAKYGLLLNGGPGMTITAIGSQNIVSTTVNGNNNATTVNTSQTSTNSGVVSNNGVINLKP